MQKGVILYCLGNNGKKKSLYPNIFDPWLVDAMDVEFMDAKG